MTETIGSAVTQEAVSHVLSRLLERYEHSSDTKDRVERMEMAHIRLEAALEASQRWSITSVPLLRWQSKLKRATQECDHTLRRCRRRLQEEEKERSFLPRRFARATMSFVSSIIGGGSDDELGRSTVRRFERFADGASEFLRYMELGGGMPRRSTFFDGALGRHLLEGKGTKNCFIHGGQHLSFVLQPFIPFGRGMEATLLLLLIDGNSPEKNFRLTLSLRLSDSTDIIGAVIRCLELFAPHLSSTVEAVKMKLTELPTQDLHWIPDAHSIYGRDEPGDNLEMIFSKWARPNPLCCQQLDHSYNLQLYTASSSSSFSEPLAYLEPVTHVNLIGNAILPAEDNKQHRSAVDGKAGDSPYLKLGWSYWPHASSENLPPVVGGLVTETIIGEATQCGMYANISFEQLGEIILPKAVDCLHGNMAATSYQALWKSKHGRACLQAEKSSWRSTTRRDGGVRRRKKLKTWTSENNEFMSNLWIEHAPALLQAKTVDWIQKQSRLPLPLLWKTSSCVHDCPIMQLSLLRSLARKLNALRA